MKQCLELNDIAIEVVNLLAEKNISINDARYVLEQTEKIILLETNIKKIV